MTDRCPTCGATEADRLAGETLRAAAKLDNDRPPLTLPEADKPSGDSGGPLRDEGEPARTWDGEDDGA